MIIHTLTLSIFSSMCLCFLRLEKGHKNCPSLPKRKAATLDFITDSCKSCHDSEAVVLLLEYLLDIQMARDWFQQIWKFGSFFFLCLGVKSTACDLLPPYCEENPRADSQEIISLGYSLFCYNLYNLELRKIDKGPVICPIYSNWFSCLGIMYCSKWRLLWLRLCL